MKENSEKVARYTLLALAGAGAIHFILNLTARDVEPSAKPVAAKTELERRR